MTIGHVLVALLGIIALTPRLAVAQPPATDVAFSGQLDVIRLVDLAAQRLHVNIEYDAAALKSAGQVTLRLDAGLSDEELWSLLNRVLIARQFATVRVAGKAAYAVVKLSDAPGVAGIEAAAGELMPGYRSATIRCKNKSAKDLAEAVGKVLSKPGGTAVVLREGVDGGLVLVSDIASRIEQALSLVALIDAPSPASSIEEVPLHNLTAQALTTLLSQVNAKREAVSGEKVPGDVLAGPDGASVLLVSPPARTAYWKDLIASLDKRERAVTLTYAPKAFAVKEVSRLIEDAVKPANDPSWRLVTDELTNAIIVTTTPDRHEEIKGIMERLDAVPAASRRPVRSFAIKNRPVREIQSTLDQLVQAGVLASEPASAAMPPSSSGTTPWPPPATPAAPAATSSPSLVAAQPPSAPASSSARTAPSLGKPTSDLTLSADEGTNTLIAMGEPRLLSQIESLLVTLDVRQPQVMLEVLIISLSESQTLDLGVELEKLGTSGDTRTRISSLFGLGSRSNGDRTVGDGLGLTGLVLNPGDFSIVLRALQTLNRGRSLSMPRLLVTNNQQATLDSVLEQPFASTNASNTVTTTSFGGTKPAGTQLSLKPQITGEGDHMLLDYSISLSAFVGAAASASLPPPRQENKVQSAASLPDGHTVVVGGIELTSEGKATNQVPGIGSVPILGELFKSRSNTQSRSRFYVFIRANILRSRGYEDLKYLSEVATGAAGVDDGWPVVEPRVIR